MLFRVSNYLFSFQFPIASSYQLQITNTALIILTVRFLLRFTIYVFLSISSDDFLISRAKS